jgi:hypothetical protein
VGLALHQDLAQSAGRRSESSRLSAAGNQGNTAGSRPPPRSAVGSGPYSPARTRTACTSFRWRANTERCIGI